MEIYIYLQISTKVDLPRERSGVAVSQKAEGDDHGFLSDSPFIIVALVRSYLDRQTNNDQAPVFTTEVKQEFMRKQNVTRTMMKFNRRICFHKLLSFIADARHEHDYPMRIPSSFPSAAVRRRERQVLNCIQDVCKDCSSAFCLNMTCIRL